MGRDSVQVHVIDIFQFGCRKSDDRIRNECVGFVGFGLRCLALMNEPKIIIRIS